MTNNQINHNLIKIIQLSLKIFDLWSQSHLWAVGWMHILTFFDILLKPPQPFTGLFLDPIRFFHLLLGFATFSMIEIRLVA